MHRKFIRSTLPISLILALSGSAYAQFSIHPTAASAPESTGVSDTGGSTANAHTRESWRNSDRARVDLNRAQIELARKEYKLAAGSLGRAAVAIDRDAERAQGDLNLTLVRDAAALRAMAAEVRARKISDPDSLSGRLVDIRADLASYHYVVAQEASGKKDYATAGHSLATAARYIENGLHSLAEKSSVELKSAEASATRLARRGADALESEYHQARDAVARGLEKLRAVRETKKASSPTNASADAGA